MLPCKRLVAFLRVHLGRRTETDRRSAVGAGRPATAHCGEGAFWAVAISLGSTTDRGAAGVIRSKRLQAREVHDVLPRLRDRSC